MPPRADTFDLAALRLSAGEGRSLELEQTIGPFELGGKRYEVAPSSVPLRLDVSRTTHSGWALRLRFEVALEGPCMRCLEAAAPRFTIDAREFEQPGGGEELESPYVVDQEIDLAAWARDALALALPTQLLCRADCAGLCPVCGENLDAAGPEHRHEAEPDLRWAKLRELEL
ncbi:MAG TPA: DUF177 domain-containing protein [Conexibacter sp.]|jgi:uncharacterized protein|nr:DUF177 domain-containing protein [Conexibacter sp.]